MSTSPHNTLDLSAHIQSYTQDFTGREWPFQAVDRWLGHRNGPRAFLLTGEWGNGKTRFAARRCQFSRGLPPPLGLTHLPPNFLSAIHFCSTRDPRWNNPYVFAESLGVQLAALSDLSCRTLETEAGTVHEY